MKAGGTLDLLGRPDAADVAYVGDRLDNDVLASASVGMRPVWLRRGPWGRIPSDPPTEAALVVDSLTELVERIDGAWAGLLPEVREREPVSSRQ